MKQLDEHDEHSKSTSSSMTYSWRFLVTRTSRTNQIIKTRIRGGNRSVWRAHDQVVKPLPKVNTRPDRLLSQ